MVVDERQYTLSFHHIFSPVQMNNPTQTKRANNNKNMRKRKIKKDERDGK